MPFHSHAPFRSFRYPGSVARPVDVWTDVVHFRIARDQVTRLRVYQHEFLLPMMRATIRSGLGDIPSAIDTLSGVTGFYIGIGMLGTPPGMDRPYTARLMFDAERRLTGPFTLMPQTVFSVDATTPVTPILHPLEERYARLVQADALLAWGEMLYRSDDPVSLERARELYKSVLLLHGKDPETMAYRPAGPVVPPSFPVENPRRLNQLDRARLALQQLDAGLNFYGYNDDTVPTLRYQNLVDAAQRWVAGAKSAQSDYLAYLGRVEQLDLDLLAAKAQERRVQGAVAIATEQVEIAKAGVVVAQKLVTDVEKLIETKKQEIEDSTSIFNQFKDYFTGMKSGVMSIADVAKDGASASKDLQLTTDDELKGVVKTVGTSAWAGSGTAGALGVVGAYAAFAVISTTTLQGMADAATKRDDELKALTNETLPAAKAAVQVQQRQEAIARLQGQIAATELAYTRDLITYQNERFLNRPKMDDPRNVNPAQQHLLKPRPPGFTPGPPNHLFQLTNSNSDRDELNTVVEWIIRERKVKKVAFIGWSAAAFTMGPYAAKNPGKVSSLFLLAPIFPPDGTSNAPAPLPRPGFPMFVSTKSGTWNGWGNEALCKGQREPAMEHVVWDAIMQSDPVGSTWGTEGEGLNRIRNFVRWGWNKNTAAQGGVLGGSVPVLIAYGEYDRQVNTSSEDPELNFSVAALYNAIAGDHKLMVKLDCAGHSVVWEMQHKNVRNLSKHWLRHLKVDGKTQGIFNMDTNGEISPAP